MLIAQITDLHVRPDDDPLAGRIVTRPFAVAAVDALLRLAPDLVLVTGDLTDTGAPAHFALVAEQLARLPMPVRAIPGNHDAREPMRAALGALYGLPAEGPLNWVAEAGGLRVIGLDTLVEGRPSGALAPETLDFADRALAADPRPTIVALHHPPFLTGLGSMDAINCLNGDALAEIVARHPHVERVIAGHHHRGMTRRWAGTVGMVCPSVAHQVHLDFGREGFPDWVAEPPAMLLHRFTPEAGLVSHLAYVDPHGGPQPYAPDPAYPPRG